MPSGVIKTFAKKSGKPKKEVNGMWKELKSSLIDEGHKETDADFYPLLVGSLKKALNIKEEEFLFADKFTKYL